MAETLSWSEARTVFRLVGELRELGHDRDAWRAHMLRSLCRLVGAPVGVTAMIPLPFVYDVTRYQGLLDLGWGTPREREAWTGQCQSDPPYPDPLDAALQGRRNPWFTVLRPDLVDDRTWYRSAHANEQCRTARIDHSILSHAAAPCFGVSQGLLFYRAWGEKPFSRRAALLVDVFHRELAYEWRQAPPEPRLSRRERETLAALLAGDSEKQVAERLRISPATVHDYVKALHRSYRVRNRAELLAAARRAPALPRLS